MGIRSQFCPQFTPCTCLVPLCLSRLLSPHTSPGQPHGLSRVRAIILGEPQHSHTRWARQPLPSLSDKTSFEPQLKMQTILCKTLPPTQRPVGPGRRLPRARELDLISRLKSRQTALTAPSHRALRWLCCVQGLVFSRRSLILQAHYDPSLALSTFQLGKV